MMMMTICIDWLGRTQRGLSEINRSEGQADPMANQQQNKIEKRQKYEKTKRQKYEIQNANTKYRLQKNVKNHPS